MARMTREESRAETRRKLLQAATDVFTEQGYGGASVDRIAERAGFSKGAFYSNFTSKEAIFAELMERYSDGLVPDLLQALDGADDVQTAIDRLAAWTDRSAFGNNWGLVARELVRHYREDSDMRARQEAMFRRAWSAIGQRLAPLFPTQDCKVEALGALVLQIVHAPAMSISSGPSAGDVLKLALGALADADRAARKAQSSAS